MVSESCWCNPAVHRQYPRWHLSHLLTSVTVLWRVKVCRVPLYLLGFPGKWESCLQISVPQVGNGFKQPSPLLYVIVCIALKNTKQKIKRAVQSPSAVLWALRAVGTSKSTEANSSTSISTTINCNRHQFISFLCCIVYRQGWKNPLVGFLGAADSRGRASRAYDERC